MIRSYDSELLAANAVCTAEPAAATFNPATQSMSFTTNNPGTDFGTRLEILSGVALLALTDLTDNSHSFYQECAAAPQRSCVTVSGSRLTPSSAYYLRIGGTSFGTGTYYLSWNAITCKFRG